MPDSGDGEQLRVEIHPSLAGIDRAAWDACAGPDNPFISHDFLSALEQSGSATPETGWIGQHLLLYDREGAPPIAAVPLYGKLHSYGEYIFDQGWADAYERAGGRYYPKLLAGVLFSPVPGPRLLIAPGHARPPAIAALARAMKRLGHEHGVSSIHVNFLTRPEWQALGDAGWLLRLGCQYHWHNDGYRNFEDFLAALNSRKRKAIRKERREVAETGLTFRQLSGDDIRPEHWDRFYRFYRNTSDRKWGDAYLTREFFHMIGASMAERILLVLAEHDGEPVAGALNLIGGDTLYGRNWGCSAHHPHLHFETCYYQAIDFTIERGLATVEAGAQGEHKIQRGYLPTETYSAHHIFHPGLRAAVSHFLDQERPAMREQIRALTVEGPYKQGGTTDQCDGAFGR